MYTVNEGFMPMTGEEMLMTAYNRAVANGFSRPFNEFVASNTHTVLSLSTIPQAEKAQLDIVKCVNGLFSTMRDRNRTLRAGNSGAIIDLIAELNKVSHSCFITNRRMEPNMGSGQFGIFIEESEIDEISLSELMEPFLWPGAFSCDYTALYPSLDPADIHTLNMLASNGQIFSIEVVKRTLDQRLKLEIETSVTYKNGMFAYSDGFIRESIIAEVNRHLGIGKTLYVNALFNIETLPNIADMTIRTKIDDEASWVTGDRQILPYESLRLMPQDIVVTG